MGYGDRGRPRFENRELRPLEVTVYDNDVEKALRTLKREIGKEGTLKTLKRKRFYEKPSEAKKRKSRDAVRRLRKTARRAAKR